MKVLLAKALLQLIGKRFHPKKFPLAKVPATQSAKSNQMDCSRTSWIENSSKNAETERDRQTDRQTETERDRDKKKQRKRETERETD